MPALAATIRKAVSGYDPRQPRDPHSGRWIDTGMGSAIVETFKEFKSAVDPLIRAVGKPAQPPTQPSNDFEEVFDQAEKEKRAFRELLNLGKGLSERIGADTLVEDDLKTFEAKAARLSARKRPQIVIAPVKRKESARAKLKRKEYGPERLIDLNRASIVVRDLDAVPDALRNLLVEAKARGWKTRRVENRFEGEGVLGYRDMAVTLESPDGHITEVQIHVDSMWRAKFAEGGHALYERLRHFSTLGRPLTPREQAEKDRLREETQQLYDRAWREAAG